MSADISTVASVFASFSFMGGPLGVLMCVRAISVAKRAIRVVRGAALVFASAALCPLRACASGGLFLGLVFVHAPSLVFLSKKGITNAYEKQFAFRNASQGRVFIGGVCG